MFRKVKFPEQVTFRHSHGKCKSETSRVEGTADGMGHCRVVLCLGQHGGWGCGALKPMLAPFHATSHSTSFLQTSEYLDFTGTTSEPELRVLTLVMDYQEQ